MRLCRGASVLGSPSGGLELLTPDVAALGRPSEDEYCPTLDDGSIGGVSALPGIILTRAAGVCWTSAASSYPEVVEIRTTHARLFPCLPAA